MTAQARHLNGTILRGDCVQGIITNEMQTITEKIFLFKIKITNYCCGR